MQLCDFDSYSREYVSNNRVKSGYSNRAAGPIDMVPGAGARSGTADGTETTAPGLAAADSNLEDGHGSPLMVPQRLSVGSSRSPSPLRPLAGPSRSPSPIPPLNT